MKCEPGPICATFLIATALLLLVQQLPRLTGWALPSALRDVVVVILVLAIAGGFFFSFFVASGKFAHDCLRTDEALEKPQGQTPVLIALAPAIGAARRT